MPQMTFDLLDGHPPVSLMLSAKDAERFCAFMGECFAELEDAERYRLLRKSATVRSDCGQWFVSCGDHWLPVPESSEYPPLHENTDPAPCNEALCDAAIDAARAAREEG